MNKIIIASLRKNAGKTTVMVGMAKALNKKIGYLKPFGDRLIYNKKRLWDYDSALIANTFALSENPEDMSIGFDHSKLRYMYDEKVTREKVLELAANMAQGKDLLFVEGGRDLAYGISVYLDAVSLARYLGGNLVIVISGDENTVFDDITYVKKNMDLSGINFKGIIINKVQNMDDFKETYLPQIQKIGVPVLGVIPYQKDLTYFSVSYLSERLFAKVVTGEGHLNRTVKNIFIGAMSVNAALQQPLLKKEGILMITGGDRTDMILVALDYQVTGIILTNNVVPPSHIISKATERKVPMLMVPYDTYETARRIDSMEPLMTKDDKQKIELLGKLIQENVNIQEIV
jgi:BioD-like phosphotransacetylase family protein